MEPTYSWPVTDLTEAWNATATKLPPGWRLDGLRCTSTGLGPEQRGDAWRAVAVAADGTTIEGLGEDPVRALDDLLLKVPP